MSDEEVNKAITVEQILLKKWGYYPLPIKRVQWSKEPSLSWELETIEEDNANN